MLHCQARPWQCDCQRAQHLPTLILTPAPTSHAALGHQSACASCLCCCRNAAIGPRLPQQRLPVGEEDGEKCEGGVGMSVDRGVDLEGDNHDCMFELSKEAAQEGMTAMAAAAGLAEC